MQHHTPIVIIGAGFAGLSCYQTLLFRGLSADNIRVIEPEDAFLYLPGIHECLNNPKRLDDLTIPYSHLLHDSWIQDRAIDITENADADSISISLDSGSPISTKYLILAAGLVPNIPVKKWQPHVHTLRSASEVQHINKALPDSSSISVIGGSYTGVEIATWLAQTTDKQVRIIHSRDRLLHMLDKTAHRLAMRHMKHLGIETILDSRAESVTETSITLDSGQQYDSDLTILATGWAHHPLQKSLPSHLAQSNRILSIGDASSADHLNTAHNAMVEGRRVARILAEAYEQDKPLLRPKTADSRTLAISLGSRNGMLTLDKNVIPLPLLTGFSKLLVEKYVMLQLRHGWQLPM